MRPPGAFTHTPLCSTEDSAAIMTMLPPAPVHAVAKKHFATQTIVVTTREMESQARPRTLDQQVCHAS